ncbi:MAG: hypothetical protein K2X71_11680 [Methylobacterium sp.]|uniref:hypothetical protein n=1 Tax=Methylobacterium sp. TaxID=409 RepID=UPI002585719F|nr:hypothetical protein [Methylobacterium sp.]MBY0296686.1 hypothetical protein [Methylobacterium sp.]
MPVLLGPPGRLDVSVDDETYEAGSGSIVVITIRNPFNTPIKVIELKEPKSSNLKPQVKSDHSETGQKNKASARKSYFENPFATALGYSIDFAGIRAKFSSQKDTNFRIAARDTSTVDIGDFGSALGSYSNVEIVAHDNATIKASPPSTGRATSGELLIQPHCEINAYLNIYTKGWLFFKPTKLNLKSELRYCLGDDKTEYTQVVSLTFDARPPLRAVVIGSVVGAVFGGLARFVKSISDSPTDILHLSAKDFIYLSVRLGGAIIMSIISTIALSRKTGAQGFITVEDFFGGFVIGVFVGYQGTSYFENILDRSASGKNSST